MIAIEPTLAKSPALCISLRGLSRFLNAAAREIGIAGDVSVLLTGDRHIRRLNREFRGKDQATDVLSFPSAGFAAKAQAGDLAISLETASRQAMQRGHTLQREVKVLMLHGLLHLAGYDHETDSGQMARKESRLRGKFILPPALIERQPPRRAPKKLSLAAPSARRARPQT